MAIHNKDGSVSVSDLVQAGVLDSNGNAIAPVLTPAVAIGNYTGLVGDGVTSDAAGFTAAVAAAVAADGILRVKRAPVAWCLRDFQIVDSKVRLVMDEGVVFTIFGSSAGGILSLGGSASTSTYVEDVQLLGGPYYFDMTLASTPGGSSGQRAITVYGVKNWRIENARGKRLDTGPLIYLQKDSGVNISPLDGEIAHCRADGATNDSYGVMQIIAASRLHVEDCFGDRGVTLRVENDGTPHGNCEDIHAEGITCIGGHAAAYLTAHNNILQNISIDDWHAENCDVGGVSISNDSGAGGMIGNIEIGKGVVKSCKTALDVPATLGTGQFGYFRVHDVYATGSTDSGFFCLPGDYENCVAEDGQLHGFRDAVGVTEGVARLRGCLARRNGKGGASTVGFSHSGLRHVTHESCEAYDDSPYGAGVGAELLTVNQQGIESSLTAADWVTGGNSTVTRTTTAGTFRTGTAALQCVSAGAGSAYTKTPVPPASGQVAAVAGTAYVVSGWFMSALESRNMQFQITQYDVSNASLGSQSGPSFPIDAGGWTQWSFVFTPVANTTHVSIFIAMLATATGDTFYYDDLSFRASAAAQTQVYGVQAPAPVFLSSIDSLYGPNKTALANGSLATHRYVSPRSPIAGPGRSRLSGTATSAGAALPALARGYISVEVNGVEKKIAYYDV